jgi:hypothetical protein
MKRPASKINAIRLNSRSDFRFPRTLRFDSVVLCRASLRSLLGRRLRASIFMSVARSSA